MSPVDGAWEYLRDQTAWPYTVVKEVTNGYTIELLHAPIARVLTSYKAAGQCPVLRGAAWWET